MRGKNLEALNQAAPFISAIAAVFSAAAAVLAVWFSRQSSTRKRIDILKGEILGLVATEPGQNAWVATKELSKLRSESAYGNPILGDLAGLLNESTGKLSG